jgi:hypothetical protein
MLCDLLVFAIYRYHQELASFEAATAMVNEVEL